MSKKILQWLLGALGILFTFRFFLPGIILGGQYVAGGATVTPQMDSEVRFLSALAGGTAAIYFFLIKDVETKGTLIIIMALTAFVGGIARVISMLLLGPPETAAQIATGLEIVLPLIVLVLNRQVAKAQATG